MRRYMAALGWPGFFLLAGGAWLFLLSLAAEHSSALPANFGWRAILDPHLWKGICTTPMAAMPMATIAAMWAVMTVAMMLPVAAPYLGAYAQIQRAGGSAHSLVRWWTFAVGYLTIWTAFGLVAAITQFHLAKAGLLTDHGASASGGLSFVLLAAAGLYQFSGLKAACLSKCRSPMTFFIGHWREGLAGAYAMGARHGLNCLGCCWALMLLAFVGGTMNIAWMGLAMVLMVLERLPLPRRAISAPIGAILFALAVMVAWNTWLG